MHVRVYLAAWPWGSIKRGHLLPFFTIMALAVEWVSRGRPSFCHISICNRQSKMYINFMTENLLLKSDKLQNKKYASLRFFFYSVNMYTNLFHCLHCSLFHWVLSKFYIWNNIRLNFLILIKKSPLDSAKSMFDLNRNST